MRRSLVAVVAHPDDESLIAGGTLALAARRGLETGAVSLTRGEHGPISDPALASRGSLADVRERELGRAAEILDLEWTRCLSYPDGELPWIDQQQAAGELAEVLAGHVPDVILTFGEDGLYGHPDHAAAAEIARQAVAGLGVSADVYEAVWPADAVRALVAAAARRGLAHGLWGLEPQAFGSEQAATVTVDVRSVLATKLSALRAHRTQVGDDHLLASLPIDLASEYLGAEAWAGPPAGRLQELLRDA